MQTTNKNNQQPPLRSLLTNSNQVDRGWTLKNIIYCKIVFVYLLYVLKRERERVTKTLRKKVLKNAVQTIIKVVIKTTIISNTKIPTKMTSRTRDYAIPIQSKAFPLRKIQIRNNDVTNSRICKP